MIRFGIIGQYQSGKSLLINCLLRRYIATVGHGVATTHTVVNYKFSEKEFVTIVYENGNTDIIGIEQFAMLDVNTSVCEINVHLNNLLLKSYELTDMPGFGYDANDNKAASKALNSIDVAIVVASNQKTIGVDSPAYLDFCRLEKYHIPYYFILNCTDFVSHNKWSPYADINRSIVNDYIRLIMQYKPLSYPFESNQLPIVNLMWYWYSINDENDTLLQREENRNAINIHRLYDYSKIEIKQASCFNLIEKIFSMENRAYLELKREFKEELAKLRDEVCPVGTIQAFAFNRIPKGWMICDGKLLNLEEHHELYQTIGTTFGGDGKTTFAIPDMRGHFIRGYDNSGKIDAERKFGSKQEDSFQNHLHDFDASMLKLSKDGSHYHRLWCNEYDTVIDVSGLASTDKAKRMCYPSNECGSDKTDLGPFAGEHSHELTLTGSPISSPKQDGNITLNLSTETRPKNVALLYCIKATSGFNAVE